MEAVLVTVMEDNLEDDKKNPAEVTARPCIPIPTKTSTGSVQSWPKGYFLLLLRLVLKNCPAAEELRNHL